jgi:hypothetical protein
MRIVSVNVGLPREITVDGEVVRTAIFKEAVALHRLTGRRRDFASPEAVPYACVNLS